MSLLESLSKPRWQHPKPEVRRAALDEVDDPDVLLEVLCTDEDAGVRAHALSRIDAADVLDTLIDNPPDTLSTELRDQACAQRLRQMLRPDGALPAEADDQTLARIAYLAVEPLLTEVAIGSIRDADARMEIAIEHPAARVRLCAAQSIEDIQSLQALMQQAKHKDKAVFQYCRERVDQHLADQRAEEGRRQQLDRVAEEAAELRTAVESPDYRARYLALQQRWAGLHAHASPSEQERIQGDLDTCARRIEDRAAEQEAEKQEQARAEKAGRSFGQLLEELDSLDPAALASEESAAALEAELNRVEESWVSALRDARPEPEQTEACKSQLGRWRAPLHSLHKLSGRSAEIDRFTKAAAQVDTSDFKALQKLQQQGAKLTRALAWPEEFGDRRPDAITQVYEAHDRLQARLADLEKKGEKVLAKVEQSFDDFRAELSTNHYRNADRALNRLRNLLRQLSPARQDHFQSELRPLLARLQEIHDWQGFAIEPKKQELIQQMQALVGSGEDPDTLAAKIKALQKEWKQLGPLSPRRDQELWQAFHSASDQAWAPCGEAFGQRARARKEIYRQRMELVAQLREYEQKIAWPDVEGNDPQLPAPDWKMVRKTLTTARRSFGELGPLDRKQERKSRKALDKVCNRIYAHLEKEYARNAERKQALVAEAHSLLEMDDLRQAIDRAKAIQREWKAVGLVPQRVDRGLWKDFRTACDAVFERLGAERDQRHAERRAAEQARAERAAERKRQRDQHWRKLTERMRACALKESDPKGAAALWGEDGDLPNGIDADALQVWWSDGVGGGDPDELRTACIAMEVLAGVDSPPDDKDARMAYQMQRLVEGMGSGQGNVRDRLRDGINGFIALRSDDSWVERFISALQAVRAGPGK